MLMQTVLFYIALTNDECKRWIFVRACHVFIQRRTVACGYRTPDQRRPVTFPSPSLYNGGPGYNPWKKFLNLQVHVREFWRILEPKNYTLMHLFFACK
jgi:hypothetical protein